jgi:hypothetical protein
MKKLIISVLVLFAGSLIALSSCSSSSKIGGNVEGDSVRTEGWIDDNTFRIAASCQSKEDVTNVVTRKNYATRCATIYAKYMIVEKFIGSKISGAAGMKNFELTGIAASEELEAVIKGGSVYKTTCDDEQNCEVIYEVKSKGLKNKVLSGGFKAK